MGIPPILSVFSEINEGKGAGVKESIKMMSMANAKYFRFLSSLVSVSRGFGWRIPKIISIMTSINHPGL